MKKHVDIPLHWLDFVHIDFIFKLSFLELQGFALIYTYWQPAFCQVQEDHYISFQISFVEFN